MNIMWGPATIESDDYTDLMLMLSFELSGATIPNNAYVMAYASLPDEDNPGTFESVACTVRHMDNLEYASVYTINNYYGEQTFTIGSEGLVGKGWYNVNAET